MSLSSNFATMSTTFKKGGDSTNRVNPSRCSSIELFIALNKFQNGMRYKTVKDQNRRATSISIPSLLNASKGYIVQPTDVYRTSKETGFPIMKSFTIPELLHTCSTWEVIGIRKGSLPLISYIDPITGIEQEAPMTMNGIEIDPTDPEVIRRISALKTYPTSVMSEYLKRISTTMIAP